MFIMVKYLLNGKLHLSCNNYHTWLARGHAEYSASGNWARTCGDPGTHAYGIVMRYWLPRDTTCWTQALMPAQCGFAFWHLNHHLREGGGTQRDALLQRFLQGCTAGNFLFLPCIFLSESDVTCGLGWCCESQCWMTLTRQHGGVCRKPCDVLCHLCNWEGSAFLPLGRNVLSQHLQTIYSASCFTFHTMLTYLLYIYSVIILFSFPSTLKVSNDTTLYFYISEIPLCLMILQCFQSVLMVMTSSFSLNNSELASLLLCHIGNFRF